MMDEADLAYSVCNLIEKELDFRTICIINDPFFGLALSNCKPDLMIIGLKKVKDAVSLAKEMAGTPEYWGINRLLLSFSPDYRSLPGLSFFKEALLMPDEISDILPTLRKLLTMM